MAQRSLRTLRQDRASQQPDGIAYTFIDYEVDSTGSAEGHARAQLHRRAHFVADEPRVCGEHNDKLRSMKCDVSSATSEIHHLRIVRTALDVEDPSVVGVECAGDEIASVTTFPGRS